MLKPYFEREGGPKALSEDLKQSPEQGTAVMLSSLEGTVEDDLTDPSRSAPVGRLENSEMLVKLPDLLSYLTPSESRDIRRLINDYQNLFRDVPSQTNVLEHDIDVGGAPPIKQHPTSAEPLGVTEPLLKTSGLDSSFLRDVPQGVLPDPSPPGKQPSRK
ncbi:hypothetical protein N1851_004119 [Merluccius polli]|uniref:Uncharacterized protein n=1 Tax=Merluccius polli TaxID=89951 RepID=A0AA47N8Z7_MERPO|nr:hypothetical protein N1851_004119 [Merluccius polli]